MDEAGLKGPTKKIKMDQDTKEQTYKASADELVIGLVASNRDTDSSSTLKD